MTGPRRVLTTLRYHRGYLSFVPALLQTVRDRWVLSRASYKEDGDVVECRCHGCDVQDCPTMFWGVRKERRRLGRQSRRTDEQARRALERWKRAKG